MLDRRRADGAQARQHTVDVHGRQAEVIAQALDVAGVDPSTIGYVEAHGTGTALGDPIEVAPFTSVY